MAIEAVIGVVTTAGGGLWAAWVKAIKPYLRSQKIKQAERDKKLTEIRDELKYNGGTSLKDMVLKIDTKTSRMELRLDGLEDNQKLAMNLQGLAFWESNDAGECTYVSPGLCKIMGRSESEIIGSGWLGWLHPDDKNRISEAWEYSIRNKSAFDEIYTFKRADGKWQKVWGVAFPRISRSHTFEGILGKLVAIEEPTKN